MKADLEKGTKSCSSPECKLKGQEQPLSNFNAQESTRDGFSYYCKVCSKRREAGMRRKLGKKVRRNCQANLETGMKICYDSECASTGEEQPLSNFSKNKSTLDGFSGICRSCRTQQDLDNLDKIKLWRKGPTYAFSMYRSAAKQYHRTFTLTFAEFMIFWQKDCIYGCKIETIGLDRIDSSQGYALNNCQPMCYPHNRMKMDLSVGEFVKLCKMVVNRHKEYHGKKKK